MKHITTALTILSFLAIITAGCTESTDPRTAGSAGKVVITCNATATKKAKRTVVTKGSHIKTLAGFISKESAPFLKCGTTGTMVFKKYGKVISRVEFNIYPGCEHALYFKGDTLVSRRLTPKGVTFLRKLCGE